MNSCIYNGVVTHQRFKPVKHALKYKTFSLLIDLDELELLSMFPKNHTKHPQISDSKRAFFIGNALVVGVIEKIGRELSKIL